MICTRRTSDWHGKAFTLSLIGYTFHMRNSCTQFWLAVQAFFTCENKAYRFVQMSFIRFFHQSHNTVHFGGLFTLKQWIFSSLKHDPVPRENKLYCFYVKNPPKRIALWDRENSQWNKILVLCVKNYTTVNFNLRLACLQCSCQLKDNYK